MTGYVTTYIYHIVWSIHDYSEIPSLSQLLTSRGWHASTGSLPEVMGIRTISKFTVSPVICILHNHRTDIPSYNQFTRQRIAVYHNHGKEYHIIDDVIICGLTKIMLQY